METHIVDGILKMPILFESLVPDLVHLVLEAEHRSDPLNGEVARGSCTASTWSSFARRESSRCGGCPVISSFAFALDVGCSSVCSVPLSRGRRRRGRGSG